MYDDLFNRGFLERSSQEYPNVDTCLLMLCPSEMFSHMIYVNGRISHLQPMS